MLDEMLEGARDETMDPPEYGEKLSRSRLTNYSTRSTWNVPPSSDGNIYGSFLVKAAFPFCTAHSHNSNASVEDLKSYGP